MTTADDPTTAAVADREVRPTAYHRPSLPTAVYEIDPEIDQRIERTIQQYSLSEKTARELLRDWCERAPFARRDIAFDSVPLRVVSSAVLHVEQLVQVEHRTLQSTTEAYQGQAEVADEPLEDLWESQRFGKFKKGSASWQRRGSTQVLQCHKCGGGGKLRCQRCAKRGKTEANCPTCKGTGTSASAGGCADCGGTGRVLAPCKACRGKGFNVCSTCGGSGRLRTRQTIKATATVRKRSVVIGAAPAVDKTWIREAASEEPEWFEGERDVLAPLTDRALPEDARVRVAQYGIRVVPVSWATFFVGKEHKVYFIGTTHELKRVRPLIDKKKVVANAAILIPLLVVLFLVGKLLFFP